MGRGNWGCGQAAEGCFDVGLFVGFVLPGPPPRGWDPQLWKKHNRMAGSSLQTGWQQMGTIGVGGTSLKQSRDNLKGGDQGEKQRDGELWRGRKCLCWDSKAH